MTKVTVVIPTMKKTKDYLKLCVESLRATVDWDIIVVSNGENYSVDDIHGITVHLYTPQQGQCNAVNLGASIANPQTDYLLVSNDDMYYAPGWNDNLRFDYMCFSPNLVEPTDNPGSAPPFLKFPGGYTLEEFDKEAVDYEIKFMTSNGKGEEETGFNTPFFINKELWNTIGGYDTRYDPWGSNSDTDLQTLVELAGVQPMRLRDVLVYHFSNKSGTFDGTHQEEWQQNFDYYRDKFGYTRDDEPIPDTWMAQGMVNWDKLKYHPEWEGKYL